MADGKSILQSLQRRWMLQGLFFCGLVSIAVSLLVMAGLNLWVYGDKWWVVPMFGAVCCTMLFLFPSWRVTMRDIARILDKQVPELEESCGLLLKPEDETGALEKLQIARIDSRLRTMRPPRLWRRKLIIGLCMVGVAMLSNMIVMTNGRIMVDSAPADEPSSAVKPVASVSTMKIRITPPAYTGRAVRMQQDPNLQIEDGALISWEIQTNVPAGTMELLFNDSNAVSLKPASTDSTLWRLSGFRGQSGFYQLKMKQGLSELYKIEVIRDEAPRINIKTPKAYTIVDPGESKKIPLTVRVQDDYGISDVTVVATLATGSGEAVKFKEQTLSFDRPFTGRQSAYDLQRMLNLDALGLHPGDELYFYCRAKDNHGQETRSDMYIISLPDTASLMSLEGLTTGVDVKPEFFRSERQIIIETEQLLRGKDTMSVQAFTNKSNDLGIDQKLLRLRYGKFLGEEAEEGGAGESFSAAGGGPEDFGNAAKVRDAFTDKHDNAEDATYFEPAIKQQLKATLTEMWNAELRLRTYKPQEALPYEYKALRLLKDLQQKSRAYVAKTGVRVTPLDMKKRLTGKLDDILAPVQNVTVSREPSVEDKLRMALSLLDQPQGSYSGPALGILQEAGRQLGRQAVSRPGEYLAGFQAMRRVLGGAEGTGKQRAEDRKGSDGERRTGDRRSDGGFEADRRMAQQAIHKMLPVPEANPSPAKGAPDAGLSQLYFSNVNKQ